MTLPLITLLFALIGCLSPIVHAADQTTQSRAIGNDVVTACVRRIQNTCIFPNDHQFMRRVAYVESKFGRDLTTQWESFIGYGGIWQMDPISLDYTQQYLSSANKSAVAAQLNVNIDALNRSAGDLQVPIAAAVAARAYVYRRVSSPIPIGVVAQAAYWKQWYNTVNGSGTAQKFIDDIAEMDRTYRCEFPGADLLFILDSSGSIGSTTFANVREFVRNVVNQLKNIGVNNYRIAIENFSTRVTIVLPFTSDRATVSAAIANINYDGGSTYMGEALDAAIGMFFGNSSSARPTSAGFPKIAVLVTDGEPNGNVDTVAAAARLRAAGVTLYAVGVGASIDLNLLNTIASTPSCLYVYTLNDYTALAADFPDELALRNCETSASAPTDTNNISSVIDQNATAYYNFVANISTGITLRMSMASGATVMYASISAQQPSSADYDFMAQSAVGNIGQIFVSPDDFAKALGGNLLPNETVPLYASITGMAADTTNNFTLQFDDGDQRVNTDTTTDTTTVKTTEKTTDKNSATYRYLSGAAYVVVVVSIGIVSIIF